MFPQITWIRCWAHILNLVGDTWHHEFKLAKQRFLLLNALFEKQINARRKILWVNFQRQNAESKSKMHLIANFTRWTSWIKASIYHKERLHLYRSFFEAKQDQVHENSNTREILTTLGTKYWELNLELAFVSFYGKSISDFMELFELKQKPLAHQVYNSITNSRTVIEAGRTQVQFPEEIGAILSEANLVNRSLTDCLITYQIAFKIASKKLNNVDIQKPALDFFKRARIFDIRQKASLSRNNVDYLNIPGFSSDIEFLNEWVIYLNAVYPLENSEIDNFCEGKKNELPLMWKVSRSL